MPIRPENKDRYPKDWNTVIVPAIRARSGERCEGSPLFPDCRAINYLPHPVTGSRVVLTVAHLNGFELETRDLDGLRHWCQRCHNAYDAPMRRAGVVARRRAVAAIGDLLDP